MDYLDRLEEINRTTVAKLQEQQQRKIAARATYDFELALSYFEAIFCNSDFMCDKSDVLEFLRLAPSKETLRVCAMRYYNNGNKSVASSSASVYASSFAPIKNRFTLSLIDRLVINERNDVRYAYSDSTEAQRKIELAQMEQDHMKLKDELKALPWPGSM